MRPIDEAEPVTHVSYFEADAFANWRGHGCRRNSNGNGRRSTCRSKATSLTRSVSTRARRGEPAELQQMYGDVWEWTRSAYSPTLAIALRPARWANTTASSCATRWSCAAAPARLRGTISGRPTEIFSNRKNAGNSPAFASPAIRHERTPAPASPCSISSRRLRIFSGSDRGTFQLAAHPAEQILLRRTRLQSFSGDLRTSRILRHPHRDGNPAPYEARSRTRLAKSGRSVLALAPA